MVPNIPSSLYPISVDIGVGRPTPDRASQTMTHHIDHNHFNHNHNQTPNLRPDIPDNNTTYKYPINHPLIHTISSHIIQHITRTHPSKLIIRSHIINITHRRLCHVIHYKPQSSVTTEYTSHTEPIRTTKHDERFKISPSLKWFKSLTSKMISIYESYDII